jgi:multidrug efflux pump subunit AcrA (membrane-fusion protein)
LEYKSTKFKIVIKRNWLIFILTVLAAAAGYFYFQPSAVSASVELTAEVQQGKFEIFVTSTGELKAKNQTEIMAPGAQLREAGIYSELKIEDLIQEGTVVKAGDYVASIEKNPIMTKLGDVSLELDKKTSEFNQARLDTTLTLREARDELYNLKFAVEQAKLEKEQSRFEAPATIRQKEIELEKANKSFVVKTENYLTKVKQAVTKVQIIQSDLSLAQSKLERLKTLIGNLTIMAPKAGMVIYSRNWNGAKKIVGSTVNSWDPNVATLPDLTQMQVITYINEVDIQKVKVGQYVEIGLDAEPGKKLEGGVIQVANVGEQKPNSDAKVFEVVIDVITKDAELRPAMTTSCKIHAGNYSNVLSIPLEAINNEKNTSFVYKKSEGKTVRQEVRLGAVNETHGIVYGGLKKADQVLLTNPADTSGLSFVKFTAKAVAPKPGEDQKWKERWAQFQNANLVVKAMVPNGIPEVKKP